MKKITVLLVSLLAVTGISATAFAAQTVSATPLVQVQTLAAADETATNEDQAVTNYIAGQEARKVYLKSLLDSSLLTQEQYDQAIAAIDADIAYVRENGLPQPPAGAYSNDSTGDYYYGHGAHHSLEGYGAGGHHW